MSVIKHPPEAETSFTSGWIDNRRLRNQLEPDRTVKNASPPKNQILGIIAGVFLAATIAPALAGSATPPSTGVGEHTPSQVQQGQQTTPQANPESIRQARLQTCLFIDDLYAKEMSSNLTGDSRIPGLPISLTIKRHSTLQRLIQLSWAYGCDMHDILAIESKKITEDWVAGQNAANRAASQPKH